MRFRIFAQLALESPNFRSQHSTSMGLMLDRVYVPHRGTIHFRRKPLYVSFVECVIRSFSGASSRCL